MGSVTDQVTGTVGYTYAPTGERLTMTLPGGGIWTYAGSFIARSNRVQSADRVDK
ncbi:MAG TPA: hypothetical protein VGS41_08675 [Chthonomonadales bacterium]|nr:hypothetical protein [Chthonomonadales bacterium]